MSARIILATGGTRFVRVSVTEVVFEELRPDSLGELAWVQLASIHKRPDFTWSCYDLDASTANTLIGLLVKQLVEAPRANAHGGESG